MSDALNSKVTEFEGLIALLRLLVHGGPGVTVETETGLRRSFAKIEADLEAAGLLGQILSHLVAAENARTGAEFAQQVATQYAGQYPDTAAGLNNTSGSGSLSRFFTVPVAGSVDLLILYRNDAGAATEIGRYPSAMVISRIAGQESAPGIAYAIVDSLGRLAVEVRDDGTVRGGNFTTLAGHSVDEHAARLGRLDGSERSAYTYALVDSLSRLALGIGADGRLHALNVVTPSGDSLAAAAQKAAQAWDAAQSGGASEFRKTMTAAMQRWGQHPRPQMDAPPTLTLTQSNTTPAGTTLLTWNAAGVWRTTGGFTSQYGANPFLQWRSRSPNGNAAGFTGAGGVTLETVHTGTALYAKLRGAGGPVRVLVGDAQGKKLGYVSKTRQVLSADGQQWVLAIEFATAATRTIVIEGDGALQFGGFWVKAGESIAAPQGVKPLVCCMGTSITEASNSWALWLAYKLGLDVYNTGVGSSGILNPGNSPRVKQMDRSQDFTVGGFILGIDENGINDTGSGLYSDPSYDGVVRQFGDEYRRVLDAWFTAHPDSPFIAWGPFWPNDNPVANAYRLRDAKQRVCSEYPLAAFIDTLTPGNLIRGNVTAVTYPATDYFAPYVAGVSDTTHPIETGQEFIGLTIAAAVESLIRTKF